MHAFSLLKILPYWIAQYIGAFFGAVVVYGVYFGMQIYYSFYKNGDNICSVKILWQVLPSILDN